MREWVERRTGAAGDIPDARHITKSKKVDALRGKDRILGRIKT